MNFAGQQPCLGCQSLENGFHLIGEWLRKAFGYEAERRSSIPSDMDEIWSNRMDDVKTPPADSPPNFEYKSPKTDQKLDVKDLSPTIIKNISPRQAHNKNENIVL
ncbi:unnamed protein product [Bursaphelenchus xylophilus]|uniref:(pine wood nematode) hypothetical protein n=1 Tax=Bursaphelenchus xylophilus TaxID=6326 RepID=A0A1I7SL37_BURXY|nr:unnamed protein product [Bursaphelenchus xylophilus]CAG9129356.1 unnamed protein product [Bursaphelenchus xylophilus]